MRRSLVASTPAGEDADCLDAQRRADGAEHRRRVDAIGAPIGFMVGPESVSELTMSDGRIIVESTIAISVIHDGMTLQTTTAGHMVGTYATDGNMIRATITNQSTEAGESAAVVDGVEISLPGGGALGEPPSAQPGFGGSMSARTDMPSTLDVSGSYGSITYTRVG